MDSINPSPPGTNPQLAGIYRTLPMPSRTGTLADGTPFRLSDGSFALGGATGGGYQITDGTSPVPTPASSQATGSILVGGGGAPANGAQPPAPGATVPGMTTAATTPATAASTTTPAPGTADAAGTGLTMAATGFGRADRNAAMRVDVGGGAAFSFPSFNSSAKTTAAPEISWDPSWKKVEKNGMWYMEAPNGVKAIPAVEYRITPKPAEKVQTVKVANGWGKKFPDGTILVFDRKEGPYRLDPRGNKHRVELGTHTIGGVQVRVFEASVVRTLDTSGKVEVFDSRGNASKGSDRGRLAAALGAADAGATMGGGKPGTDSGPSTLSGGGKPGMLVGGGGKVRTTEQLTGDVQHLTSVARGILDEVRSGNVDPARLASLQAQLNALPSGILQAAGAGGSMTGSLVPGTTTASSGSQVAGASGSGATPPPGSTVAGGGTAGTPPTPGRDANATSRELPAGSKARLGSAIPAEFNGKQARFGQLPSEVQDVVARAFGSDQGSAAFKADQLVSFNAGGEVSLVDGGTVYLKHQAQVRGAGPGEDMAITVRPGRQPGAARQAGAAVSGGGGTTGVTTGIPTAASSTHSHGPVRPSSSNVVTIGSGVSNGSRIELFRPGGEMRNVAFGEFSGSFTWKTLPAPVRTAIMRHLAEGTTEASRAYQSRQGAGWAVDPNAAIVIDAGFANFINGLSLVRATPTPPVRGGGASSQPAGHDATRPVVSVGGGSGVGSVAPGTRPPVPAVNEPAGSDGHAHAH